jgi:uncharacterized protein (DUF1015 family)
VPRFEPFAGVRYDPTRVDLDDVIAPPYDVIGPDERARLEARSPWNVVRIDLSEPEAGRDRYDNACHHFHDWLDAGVLVADEEPSFYVYRMGFHDEQGRPRQTAGVIGALELSVPGQGDVLPHERTMSKPKDDRLDLMRACRANLSPVWGLSLAAGLSSLCELPGPPVARTTDDEGVHHRLWRISQPGVVEAIASAVASSPVVIADGHHRYETALAYRDEQRAAGSEAGPHDLLMAYIVELADEQLTVRPIHRLVSGLPPDLDLVEALSPFFDPFEAGPLSGAASLPARMADAGALALVRRDQTWLLRPRPDAFTVRVVDGAGGRPMDADGAGGRPMETALDSSRLATALDALPQHHVAYQHGVDAIVAAVEKGDAQAGFLLRPATVAQIAAAARARRRMPAKTTFFYPKPRTGLVFRRLSP